MSEHNEQQREPQTPPREEWYTNKEMFEKLIEQHTQIEQLRHELKSTREHLHKYNALITTVNEILDWKMDMEGKRLGKQDIGTSIRAWTGWGLAVVMLIVNLILLISIAVEVM